MATTITIERIHFITLALLFVGGFALIVANAANPSIHGHGWDEVSCTGCVDSADIKDSSVSLEKLDRFMCPPGQVLVSQGSRGMKCQEPSGDLPCMNCVGRNEIANNAVGTDEIANNAVTSSKISDGSVTSADIGDGQVGFNDINPNQVQRRVNQACPAGSSIRWIKSDGSVECYTVSKSSAVYQCPSAPDPLASMCHSYTCMGQLSTSPTCTYIIPSAQGDCHPHRKVTLNCAFLGYVVT